MQPFGQIFHRCPEDTVLIVKRITRVSADLCFEGLQLTEI